MDCLTIPSFFVLDNGLYYASIRGGAQRRIKVVFEVSERERERESSAVARFISWEWLLSEIDISLQGIALIAIITQI